LGIEVKVNLHDLVADNFPNIVGVDIVGVLNY